MESAKLENTSITIPYFSMIKDGITLSSIQRHENNVELTQKKFKEFYEFYRSEIVGLTKLNDFQVQSKSFENPKLLKLKVNI